MLPTTFPLKPLPILKRNLLLCNIPCGSFGATENKFNLLPHCCASITEGSYQQGKCYKNMLINELVRVLLFAINSKQQVYIKKNKPFLETVGVRPEDELHDLGVGRGARPLGEFKSSRQRPGFLAAAHSAASGSMLWSLRASFQELTRKTDYRDWLRCLCWDRSALASMTVTVVKTQGCWGRSVSPGKGIPAAASSRGSHSSKPVSKPRK